MDYYKILNISSNASIDEVKNSYKKLLFQCHKENNNNNSKLLNEAYNQILNNYRNTGNRGNNFNMNAIDENIKINSVKQVNEINHIYDNNSNNKPEDIIITKNITLKESYTGYIIPINIQRYLLINSKKIIEEETIYINLPKGIDNNEMILLENKGNINEYNIKGDVKIFININETYNFSRNGIDLYYYKTISLKEALCGFSFSIPFLNNENIIINNEKGNIIQPLTTKIIKNFGMQRENIIGNLIIIFNIIYPTNINKTTASKLEEIFTKEIIN